ncbi:MAG TPA: hypothetical protein VGK00_08335 [Anaerolineales bacterium]|jgi:hypothetical protein
MNAKKHPVFFPRLFAALLAVALTLSACTTAAVTPALPEATAMPAPAETAQPATSLPPEPTSAPAQGGALQLVLDTTGIASSLQSESVPAVAAGDNAPYWDLLPAYTRVTLQGYPISAHLMQAQIFIYPVRELGQVNEGAGTIVAALQSMLATPQESAHMPFLPLFNASQVLHAQVQTLDFKNGKGLRYLTQFDQAPLPVNNHELIYTYQGLSSDGKYYVAAVLPVNHPSLPANERVSGNEPPEFRSDFPAYLANVTKSLNEQPANTFIPDLTKLDAMLASMEIK